MKSVIGLSARDREALFSATSQKLGFGTEVIVEKDFWVSSVASVKPIREGRVITRSANPVSYVQSKTLKRFAQDLPGTLDIA
jgi:hypothetical protein